ncbi:MAG: anti-sigma regulatory factor [Firmicutes bacterium]|nr:anti-sigma regulatory factor [Bacillota bacterium]MDH7494951.1 anti-sigma regulatory factor [Bacillota bacterium]
MRMECKVAGGDFQAAGEAAAKLKRTLRQVGVDAETARRAAIVAYEAEMNIVIHAFRGVLTVEISPERIEIAADDEGPGIPDIHLAMQEGYSTAPEHVREMGFGAGLGLPNMKRYSDEFRIESTVGRGTSVRMIINLPSKGSLT